MTGPDDLVAMAEDGGAGITGRDYGSVRVLHVSVAVDGNTADEWQRSLTSQVGAVPPTATALVIDLTGVEVLSAAGIRALRAAVAAAPDGLRTVVVAQGLVLRSLELTDLNGPVQLERKLDTVLTALLLTDEVRELRARLRQREQQLASQPVIEQAKGMLIQDFGLSEQAAFDLLVALSQDSNTKLRDLAQIVVHHLTANVTPEVQRSTLDILADLRDRLR